MTVTTANRRARRVRISPVDRLEVARWAGVWPGGTGAASTDRAVAHKMKLVLAMEKAIVKRSREERMNPERVGEVWLC
jgi:hypothetical protein